MELKQNHGIIKQVPVPQDYTRILARFKDLYPNMDELADLIEGRFDLLMLGGVAAAAAITSGVIVLDGPPGIGKTAGLRYLASEMGIAFSMIGFAELTNGFDISGQSSGWSTGKPGLIARLIIGKQVANPLVVLDELDKGHQAEGNFPPFQPLYTLLEQESAAYFKDEFLNLEMDASNINWLATCNDFDRIPEPIRDRARRIVVKAPNEAQRCKIIQSIYREKLRKAMDNWGRFFSPDINPEVVNILAGAKGVSVRSLVDLIDQCVVAVARRRARGGDLAITAADAETVIRRLNDNGVQRTPIGFIY